MDSDEDGNAARDAGGAEPQPVDLSLSQLDASAPTLSHQPSNLRPSYGGRRRTDADRLLNTQPTTAMQTRLQMGRVATDATSSRGSSGWVTPRDSRSSLSGLHALARSSVSEPTSSSSWHARLTGGVSGAEGGCVRVDDRGDPGESTV